MADIVYRPAAPVGKHRAGTPGLTPAPVIIDRLIDELGPPPAPRRAGVAVGRVLVATLTSGGDE